ncbi:MAG: hypothetical protein K2I92_04190 [Muribaculaceae bacterium]|nr:hypothetical protein [Muribaculaceae bacterium]
MKSNYLRKRMRPIFIGLITLTAFPGMASSDKSPQSNGDAILTQFERDPLRKRMPSRNYLEVVYTNGVLQLLSPAYEGEFFLSFENSDSGEYHAVSSICVNETMDLQLQYGVYDVLAIGVDGTTLVGSLEVY